MSIVRKLKSWTMAGRVRLSNRTRESSHASGSNLNGNTYESLYEGLAVACSADEAVGEGTYEVVGQVELDVLKMEGLQPGDTLLDFGCGNGRLAVHAIPFLVGGQYIGTDISQTFLVRARDRIRQTTPDPPCRVSWVQQSTPHFPMEDRSVDQICAFSVFTHLEHEDSYRYLVDALRVVRPGGKFVFSCLPITLEASKPIFLAEAGLNLTTRWSKVRNVVTSVDFMSEIARLAGWKVVRWYAGDVGNIKSRAGEMRALGQSTCVLEAPDQS